MNEVVVAVVVFLSLAGAATAAMYISSFFPERHRGEDTTAVIRGIAGIFVVMTSLVFGLMINSAKNTFASIDDNIHAFATNLIILDRALRNFGAEGAETRVRLMSYVEEAITNPTRIDDVSKHKKDTAGEALDAVGKALAAIEPADRYHEATLVDLRQQYHRLIEQRWQIIEDSEGGIPPPLIVMLITWMVLIFGSFGYRAPSNAVVIASFLTSAALIAGAFYLVLNMDIPFSGPIQISDAPLHRALAAMKV